MKIRSTSPGVPSTACALLLAISIGACKAGPKVQGDAAQVSAAAGELRGDPDLEARLEVLDPSIRDSGTGRVLGFELRSKSAAVERLCYAIEWFDRRGAPVASNRFMWTPLVLEAGASNRVEVSVPVPEAESWRWHAVRADSAR
jgi:hypothetical protein